MRFEMEIEILKLPSDNGIEIEMKKKRFFIDIFSMRISNIDF